MNLEVFLQEISSLSHEGRRYLFTALQLVLILGGGLLFSRWLSSKFRRVLSVFRHMDETVIIFLTGVIQYSLVTLTIIICLSKLGVQTASIITVLGTAGLAIGLALQGTLANIASGIMILILRPFKIGDYIESGESKGTVESISLFSTQLKDSDGVFLMTPNSLLWSRTVKNFSRNEIRRVSFSVGVSYNDELNSAKEIILDRVNESELVFKNPAPSVLVDLLDASSVNLKVSCWVKRQDYVLCKSYLTQSVKEVLDENGITIPFPQQEVTILGGGSHAVKV